MLSLPRWIPCWSYSRGALGANPLCGHGRLSFAARLFHPPIMVSSVNKGSSPHKYLSMALVEYLARQGVQGMESIECV